MDSEPWIPDDTDFRKPSGSYDSDFQQMPMCLVFPNVSWLLDKLNCCRKGMTQEESFCEVELPSMTRNRLEEAALDDYFSMNGINVVDSEGSHSEENKQRHKIYYTFGFGYLALLRSMRFLGLLFFAVAFIMLVSGFGFLASSLTQESQFTFFDELSIANSDFASNVCIQQYVTLNETRTIDCGYSFGFMNSLYAQGIVPSTTAEYELTQCGTLALVTDQNVVNCSEQNLDNYSLQLYFQNHCQGRKSCEINLSQFVIALPSSICYEVPARVYVQLECTLNATQMRANSVATYINTGACILASLLFTIAYFIHSHLQKTYKAKVIQTLVQPALFTLQFDIQDMQVSSETQQELQDFIQNRSGQEIACISIVQNNARAISQMTKVGDLILRGESGEAARIGIQRDEPPRVITAFITFQTTEGQRKAMALFKAGHFEFRGQHVVLYQPKSPNTFIWENMGTNSNFKLKVLFVLFYIGYIACCILVMILVKWYMVSIRFNYVFFDDCADINSQFSNMEDWLDWATIDRKYLYLAETTGIYQCYCLAKVNLGPTNFWRIWTDPNSAICSTYALDGMGGTIVSLPCGITNSIMTNVGVLLITKFVYKLKLASKNQESLLLIFSIFIMAYTNAGILPLQQFRNVKWMPQDFTSNWLLFYSKMILTSLLLSNLMPYMGPLVSILKRRRCLCCKRSNYKPETCKNKAYPLEQRYASILTTVMISFTYGASMPSIFVFSACVITANFVMDKLLITYFYKQSQLHNDFNNRIVLRLIKYLVILLPFGGAIAQASNYNQITNINRPIHFGNEYLMVFKIWESPQILLFSSLCLLVFLVSHDVATARADIKAVPDGTYFSRLSNLDRKRWIAEEHYRRQHFQIKTLSDSAYEALKRTPGKRFAQQKDPYNYDVLSNNSYVNQLHYVPLPLLTEADDLQQHVSRQITLAFYGHLQEKKTSIQ